MGKKKLQGADGMNYNKRLREYKSSRGKSHE